MGLGVKALQDFGYRLSCILFGLPLLASLFWVAPVNAGTETLTRVVAYTYRDDDASKPVSLFAPTDGIALRVRAQGLAPGAYTLEAQWFNALAELQEQAQLPFTMEREGDFAADFSLKLRPAGLMSRMLTSVEEHGYSQKMFGRWRVTVFLDNRELARREFEVR